MASVKIDFATSMSCIFDAPQSMKLALLMHFMYIKRVSGESQSNILEQNAQVDQVLRIIMRASWWS